MSSTARATTAHEKRVDAIDEAIAEAGGVVRLAASMGVSCRQVYSWRTYGYIPVVRAIAIETIFGIDHERLIHPGLVGFPSDNWRAIPDQLD